MFFKGNSKESMRKNNIGDISNNHSMGSCLVLSHEASALMQLMHCHQGDAMALAWH